jgi:hypothetical protein
MSRFEDELIKRLSEASDEVSQAIDELQLAAYRARKGQTSSSRMIIDSVRARFASSDDSRIFARINLAESIHEFYINGVNSAFQKLRRSQALLIGCPTDRVLKWEASAWMASFMRILRKWPEFESELRSILPDLEAIPLPLRARVGLVIADSLQEVGDCSSADLWYSEARAAALQCGDDSMFGAALYNRVAIRVYGLRMAAIFGDSSDLSGCKVELEAATAKNYSQYTHDYGMSGVFSLLQGQLAILNEDFVEAVRLLTDESVWSLVREWPSVALILRADVLLGQVKLGKISTSELREQSNAIAELFEGSRMYGDIAIAAHSLNRSVHDMDEDFSAYLNRLVDESLVKFAEDQAAQKAAMQSLGLCSK